MDFAVAVESDADAEALVLRLRERGYELHDVLEQTAQERFATARFRLGSDSARELERFIALAEELRTR